jgi:hypothetical protein
MSPPDDRSSSGLLHAFYPDTGESGDTYDIDVLTRPIMGMRQVGLGSLSPNASLGALAHCGER